MPRLALYIIWLALPFNCIAQDVVMENGKLLYRDSAYATYEEVGEKKNSLPVSPALQQDFNPEISGSNFKDFIFSSIAGEQLIFATAKLLSMPGTAYLKYYYNIQFAHLDEQLNMQYHPQTISRLANDIIKYKLFNNDQLDENAALRLITVWNKKPNAITEKQMQISSTRNYNNSIYHVSSDFDKNPIHVEGHKIYYSDSVIGSYYLSKGIAAGTLPGSSKEDLYYYIDYPDGKLMAEVQLMILSSSLLVWPAPLKDPFKIYTAEREEGNIIKVACILLWNRQQQLAASHNK